MMDTKIRCHRAEEHEIEAIVLKFVRPSTGETEFYCSIDCAAPGIAFSEDVRDREGEIEKLELGERYQGGKCGCSDRC